ncbi:MAG: hypothetical protein ABGW87_08450 [Sphingomonadaceae bacterium]
MDNKDPCAAESSADRFDHVDALLQRYPQVTEDELGELKHWFRKEASAFEVASLSSKDSTNEGYRRFRSEHIDPFTFRDFLSGGVMLVGLVVLVAIIWLLKK